MVPHHLLPEALIEDFFSYIASQKKPDTIILLSPDHFKAGSLLGSSFISLQPDTENFQGMKVNTALIKELSLKGNILFSDASLKLDHGITNLVPFIEKYFPHIKVVPFIVPSTISLEETERFVQLLNSLASRRAMVVASVDFSHHLSPSAADFHDVKAKRVLINFEKKSFPSLEVDSWQALFIARSFAELREKEFPKIIGRKKSTDFLVKNPSVLEDTTSYLSLVFEEQDPEGLAFVAAPPSVSELNEFNGKTLKAKTVLLLGDIMLDRGVEYQMQKNSPFYPLLEIEKLLKGVDIVFGNLEGPIVEKPPSFSDASLKFAFKKEMAEILAKAGFNLLSLANNHTLNMGSKGLAETKKHLKEAGIDFIGDPIDCKKEFVFKKEDLIFLAFNQTFAFNCGGEEISKLVESVRASSTKAFLVVSLHWGNEYQLKNSSGQKSLAHKIIEAGADLIIGHHPHVVQNIEIYKGKMIFYSLGNFIFDQYFSKETQESLAVGVEVYPDQLIYRLFPIQSKLSQPSLAGYKESGEFLEELAERSSSELVEKIKRGIIELKR